MNRPSGSMNDAEREALREHYHWEIVGPNPL
jgi:hypothetical protein